MMLKRLAIAICLAASGMAFAADTYDPSQSYPAGSQVNFNGNVYEAQWWANPNDSPAKVTANSWESPWVLVAQGGGNTGGSGNGSGGATPPPTTPPTPTPPPVVDPSPPKPPLEGDYPPYAEGTTYKANDVVAVDGQLYRCKPGVTVAWCSGAAWAYAPGTGSAWVDAWEKIAEEDVGKPPVTTPGGGATTTPPPVITPPPTTPPPPTTTPPTEPDKGPSGSVGPNGTFEIKRSELNAKEAELTDFKMMTLVKEAIRTRPNTVVERIMPLAADNPENVKRVEGFLSAADWEFLFPERAPEYTYRNFLQAVAKFPALCGTYTDGRDSDMICRKTLATMFAHFAQETGGHSAYWDVPEWRQALVHVREMGWTEEGRGGYNGECGQEDLWQQQKWPCGRFSNGDFKSYFGRGAKQLSYNYNYGPFSEAIYGDVSVLLQNPELVADTWLNLASAVFFYLYPQPPKPSMLHVIDGTWQPNERDKSNGLVPGFGATIQIINGGVECGGSVEVAQSLNRIEYYKNFAEYFGVEVPADEVLGCKGMKSFDADGSGAVNIYWVEDWGWRPDTPDERSYSCQLVGYQTAYSAFVPGDYAECVKGYFPNTVIVEDTDK